MSPAVSDTHRISSAIPHDSTGFPKAPDKVLGLPLGTNMGQVSIPESNESLLR